MSYENDMNILRKIKEIREGTQADSARSPEGEKPFIGDDQLASDLAEAAIEVRLNIGAKLYNDEDVQEKRDLSERLDLHAITRIRSTEASTEECRACGRSGPEGYGIVTCLTCGRRRTAAPPSTPDGVRRWLVVGERRDQTEHLFVCEDYDTQQEPDENALMTRKEAHQMRNRFERDNGGGHYTYTVHPIGPKTYLGHSTGEGDT